MVHRFAEAAPLIMDSWPPVMSNADFWNDQVRTTLEGYEEGLLRQIAVRLFRPRNQWPVDELIERTLSTLGNIPVLDRRIKDLSLPCRQVPGLDRPQSTTLLACGQCDRDAQDARAIGRLGADQDAV